MAVKKRGKKWYVVLKWNEFGKNGFRKSVGTKALAEKYERMVIDLRHGPYHELVLRVHNGELDFEALYEAKEAGTLADLFHGAKEGHVANELITVLIVGFKAWLIHPNTLNRRKAPFSADTIDRYLTSMKVWQRFLTPEARFNSVNKQLLQRFKRGRVLLGRGPAPKNGDKNEWESVGGAVSISAWNNDIVALQTFIRYCVEEEDHPTPDLKLGAMKRTNDLPDIEDVEYVELDEQQSLDDALLTEREADQIFIKTLLQSGMRASEAGQLRVRHIDIRNGEFVLKNTGDTVQLKLKTKRAYRRIPMHESLAEILKPLVASARRRDGKDGIIFPRAYDPPTKKGEKRNRTSYNRMWEVWEGVLQRAGIDHMGLHATRHTFAVRAVQNGIDLSTLGEWLGHSTMDETRRYARFQPKDAERKKLIAMALGKAS